MEAQEKVDELLKSSGAVLLRSRKHEVWRLPNGNKFVRAKTTSDCRSALNDLSDLRRALGIEDQRGEAGERRQKKVKSKRQAGDFAFEKANVNSSLADGLRVAGLVESALRAELDAERLAFKNEIAEMAEELSRLEARKCACWWCRLMRFGLRLATIAKIKT